MPKKKTRVIQFAAPMPAPVVETLVPLEAEIEPSVGDEPTVKLVYEYPKKSRCRIEETSPGSGVWVGCGSLSTRAKSTQDPIQYRQCLRPSCRHRYKETGTVKK